MMTHGKRKRAVQSIKGERFIVWIGISTCVHRKIFELFRSASREIHRFSLHVDQVWIRVLSFATLNVPLIKKKKTYLPDSDIKAYTSPYFYIYSALLDILFLLKLTCFDFPIFGNYYRLLSKIINTFFLDRYYISTRILQTKYRDLHLKTCSTDVFHVSD